MNIHDATHRLLDQAFAIISELSTLSQRFWENVVLILDAKTDMVRHDLSHIANVIILFT